jgi:hypothetical protein
MPRAGGPYLIHAAVCERVLQEADGVLSLIRIIDRLTVNTQVALPPGVTLPPGAIPGTAAIPPYPVTLAIAIRSGSFRGSLPLRVRLEAPSGLKLSQLDVSVTFEGEDRGANLVLPFQFPLTEEGLHWFVVELGGELMTRAPVRVLRQTTTQSFPPQLD